MFLTTISRKYRFHSAHRNTQLVGTKCESIHGHTYHVEVELANPVHNGDSIGREFRAIDELMEPLIEVLDHSFIIWREDPIYEALLPYGLRMYPLDCESSAENLAKHVFDYAKRVGLPVLEVTLRETPSSSVKYRG